MANNFDAVVVDTNVTVVANHGTNHACPKCVKNCVDALQGIVNGSVVVLDTEHRIIKEYMNHLSFAGEPGVGDMFFKWLWENQANPERVERVEITPVPGHPEEFAEFPSDPEFSGFDVSDQKFVGVALGSQRSPPILNATDTGWWTYREALEKNGCMVKFLCPWLMT